MSGHVNIYDNEQADIAATANFNSNNIIDCSSKIDISLTYFEISNQKITITVII
jgi:hypothetical protein